MKTMTALKNALLVLTIALAFSCKKQDEGELNKEGATSDTPVTEMKDNGQNTETAGKSATVDSTDIGSGNKVEMNHSGTQPATTP